MLYHLKTDMPKDNEGRFIDSNGFYYIFENSLKSQNKIFVRRTCDQMIFEIESLEVGEPIFAKSLVKMVKTGDFFTENLSPRKTLINFFRKQIIQGCFIQNLTEHQLIFAEQQWMMKDSSANQVMKLKKSDVARLYVEQLNFFNHSRNLNQYFKNILNKVLEKDYKSLINSNH